MTSLDSIRTESLPFGAHSRPYRPVLVDIGVVSKELGVTRDTILDWVDLGVLLHVWNMAAQGARSRVLRFDMAEVLRRSANLPGMREDELATANRIVGHPTETALHTETVANMLWTTRRMVHDWIDQRELIGSDQPGHRQMVTRTSLVEFLIRRRV